MSTNFYNPYVREELELYHHGILGMKWGKRNGPPYPLDAGDHSAAEKKAGWRDSLDKKKQEYHEDAVRKKTIKTAKKDAKRYADAKMYYGEGAGTRRKLLNAELSKKKKDPIYKETFEKEIENADYSKSAKRAKRERKTRDTFNMRNAKRVANTAIAVASAATAAEYAYYNATGKSLYADLAKKVKMPK